MKTKAYLFALCALSAFFAEHAAAADKQVTLYFSNITSVSFSTGTSRQATVSGTMQRSTPEGGFTTPADQLTAIFSPAASAAASNCFNMAQIFLTRSANTSYFEIIGM